MISLKSKNLSELVQNISFATSSYAADNDSINDLTSSQLAHVLSSKAEANSPLIKVAHQHVIAAQQSGTTSGIKLASSVSPGPAKNGNSEKSASTTPNLEHITSKNIGGSDKTEGVTAITAITPPTSPQETALIAQLQASHAEHVPQHGTQATTNPAPHASGPMSAKKLLVRSTTAPAIPQASCQNASNAVPSWATGARPASMVEGCAQLSNSDFDLSSEPKAKRQGSLPKRIVSFLTTKLRGKNTNAASNNVIQFQARQTIGVMQNMHFSMDVIAEPQTLAPIVEQQEKDKRFAESDFERMLTLATGSFGAATLCRHKPTGRPCVIKSVEKYETVMKSQTGHLLNERNSMLQLTEGRCPFIVQTYGAFHDKHNLHFVLEYVPGGELFGHMRRSGRLPEAEALFYSAQVLVALEIMHVEHGIVYRDLKPENILIGSDGYIKLCDFGFAKKLRRMEKTYTQCGTSDYLSPETILSKGHGHEVDLWTLGVLMYEMLAGDVPFKGINAMALYANIIKGKFDVPLHFSEAAKHIVEGLLCVDRTKRLGCTRLGIAELRKTPFFRQLDFALLAKKQLPAPYIPHLDSAFDNQLFAGTASPLQDAVEGASVKQMLLPALDAKHFSNFDCFIKEIV